MWRVLVLGLALLGPMAAWAGETQPYGRGSYAALVQQQAGRPTVIAFWSLTCAPCLAELPHWPRLTKRFGFDLILVSTDSLEQAPALEARLKRAGLGHVPSYAFAESFTERLLYEAAPDWRGELPRSHLIAADGTLTPILGMVGEENLRLWARRP